MMISNLIDKFKSLVLDIYIGIPDNIKYGKIYKEQYNFLNKTQYWSEREHKDYQVKQIKKLLNHAYDTVPYYHKLFKELNMHPRDINTYEDFQKIPYLTKEIVQNNLKDLISTDFDINKLKVKTTGGSTGTPMEFYVDRKYDNEMEWAFVSHMWARVGYNPNKMNRTIYLRGNVPKSGLYEKKMNTLILSSYKLNEKNYSQYLTLLLDFKPIFIRAYPSSIFQLADYILDNNLEVKIPSLKAILTSSENLHEYQKDKIEKAFNVRVFDFYGLTEHTSIAGQCEEHNYYHFQSEYGFTELLDENGNQVKTENEIGEIVSTGFNNYVMPFIRYKTDDYGVNTTKLCSCNRNYKLIKKIHGRVQEQIVTEDFSKVALTSIIFSQHFDAFGRIKKLQIIQSEVGKVKVKIVPKDDFNNYDKNEIITKMRKACDDKLDIIIEEVSGIERTDRGKHKFLIQNLDLSKF